MNTFLVAEEKNGKEKIPTRNISEKKKEKNITDT